LHHLFLDESGEFGQAAGSSRHLLIAILCPPDAKRLKNVMRKEKKRLHDLGWPINLEIKGTSLWGCEKKTEIPLVIREKRIEHLKQIITRILEADCGPSYAIINKSGLAPHLRDAPYGIAYNYFTGNLLCKMYDGRINGPVTLIVDQRNKETHHQMPFDGYVKTRVISDCSHGHPFSVLHEDSSKWLGLQACDFISWGLFRHYEHGDSQFRDLIRPKIGIRDNWYA
jgi:hypothetical protein